MKLLRFLLVLSLMIVSCDDPSLNQQNGEDGDVTVEPMPELKQLNAIQIAQDTQVNVTENISVIYDDDSLISQVTFSGTTDVVFDFEYSENNRLQRATKIDGTSQVYNFTYDEDSIFIDFINISGDIIEKQFFTDTQNRINRILTTSTDVAGLTTRVEDLRYQYTANFNVSRINSINANGFNIDSYTEFTYEFNNNPFRDMNDVLRLIIFPEFIPYTRYLPSSRIDYTITSSGAELDRSQTYVYTLQDDDFPSSSEITTVESGMTSTSFQFFNYL